MSTQQQIQAWQQALTQKQQERADQLTILKVQQEQLAKYENLRADAELEVQRAINRGAPDAEVKALIRQQDQYEDAETDARIASSKTEDNIAKLDGSIRYNQSQLNLYQGSLPAQANPSSTVADVPANAASNVAETAPAPQPVQTTNSTTVTNSDQGGFVTDPNTGEFIPTDSAQAEAIRAEQNRVQTDVPLPVFRSAIEEGGEVEAQAALAARNAVPEPVPPNLTQAWDPETGSYGVWDEDKGQFVETGLTEEEATRAAGDPFEAARLAREAEFAQEQPAVFEPNPVPGNFTAVWDSETESWGVWNNDTGEFESTGLTEQEAQLRADDLSTTGVAGERPVPTGSTGLTEEEQRAKDEAAAKANAINQATRQSVYKQGGSTDWRVRLQLSPTSNYLYNQPQGQRGVLDPLFYTNGVIFPYTPQIQTTYQAKYADYDLVHSNFRGVFYQSSRVDDINIRAEFTAQDTNEANYLLAVIHFFRSVTKMFYGKDTERGTPPPLVYLSGMGMDQFYGHPCLVRSFQYALPNNVDYIRATNVNNYGTNLLNRRTASAPSSVAGLGPTGNRLINAGLNWPSESKPAPTPVVAQVDNTQLANYVPTKMEIDIVLIPVQTRSQVSKQFSLKGFANGNLIKNGFW